MNVLNIADLINLPAAAFGAAGSIVLAFGTYSMEPPVGRAFWAEAVIRENPPIEARNKTRRGKQRLGLGLILLAFLLQGAAVIAPKI